MDKLKAIREIIEELKKAKRKDERTYERIVKKVAKRYGLETLPKKTEVYEACNEEEKKLLSSILVTKPVRTISGVSVITVVSRPWPCPGRCIYCPRGNNAPQSYTGLEPAIQRAIRNSYDPYKQTLDRLKQYEAMAQPSDKVEIIILGGTFTATPKDYQVWFVKRIFDALNGKTSESLEEAIKINESAEHRCVGLTVETRPDYCFEPHVDLMLSYGTTRVEIGVQSVYDDVLALVQRGHTVEDVVKATRIAKDAGLKVVYHLMPGLPGSSFERDLEMFKQVFTDPRFMPDGLKIYPTVVVKGTKLYEMWKKGEYKPLRDEEAIKLLVEVKKLVPPFVRIRRVIRDIPATQIEAGVKKSNLRELVLKELEKQGLRCRCTRCREVGHVYKRYGLLPKQENIKLIRREYEASEGLEIFLSFEDVKQDILIALLRLRLPSEKAHRKEVNKEPSMIIRELHTYGKELRIGQKPREEWQHRGFGKELVKEAEEIAKYEFGVKKLLVISGVGVRNYFRKLGFELEGPYMAKRL